METNGLIERQSYRGFSVSYLNAQKVREIFELRASVETLAAELFTERASVQEVVALSEAFSVLAAGNTVVLKTSEHASAAMLEFGGIKDSGYGRESGFQAMYDYTRPKTVWMNTSDQPQGNRFVER